MQLSRVSISGIAYPKHTGGGNSSFSGGSAYFSTARFGYFRIVLALFLLAAAGLKLYGLGLAGVPQVGPFSAPGVQLAAILWEIILGAWLLSGRQRLGSWTAAGATFLTFAGASGYLGWIGQAHCGCFGAIKASPWHAFAIDIVALLALVWARPNFRMLWAHRRAALRDAAGPVLTAGFGAALFFSVLASAGIWRFGSLDGAIAYVRGERISLRPDVLDLGRGTPGQVVAATAELTNRTDRPVRIIGGTSDCSCLTTEDLPITLEPGESRSVSVLVRLPRTTGLFNRKAFFWTDDAHDRTIVFQLSGRVDPSAEAPAVSE